MHKQTKQKVKDFFIPPSVYVIYVSMSICLFNNLWHLYTGPQEWDWPLEKWCGEGIEVPDEFESVDGDVVSSGQYLLIYFKANQWETERGFVIEYFSEPKNLIVYSDPELGLLNYILILIFFAIIAAIVITVIIITLLRSHNERAKAAKPPHPEYAFQSHINESNPDLRPKTGHSKKRKSTTTLRNNRIGSLISADVQSMNSAASTPTFGRRSPYDPQYNVIAHYIASSGDFTTNDVKFDDFMKGSKDTLTTAF